MSITSRSVLRAMIPLLKPSDDPNCIQQFVYSHIPPAEPARSNLITNNHTLTPFLHKLCTTPVTIHDALVFKFVQEQELIKRARVSEANQSLSAPLSLASGNAPPVDMSWLVARFWMCLDDTEKSQWAELARDIRNAYQELIAAFGDGVIFEANTWEEERNYRTNNIFLKWLGAQMVQSWRNTNHVFSSTTSGESGQMNMPFQPVGDSLWNPSTSTYGAPSAM